MDKYSSGLPFCMRKVQQRLISTSYINSRGQLVVLFTEGFNRNRINYICKPMAILDKLFMCDKLA